MDHRWPFPSAPALGSALCLLFCPFLLYAAEPPARGGPVATVVANDNTRPAGHASDGTLTLDLRAGLGRWRPEDDDGPALQVEALGEIAGPLQVPAPLVRVREGTVVVASVRNDLATTLSVHGLCARDGSPCAPLDVPSGETRQVRFSSGRRGTYHYWATTTGMPVALRALDAQLSGAFVVDPEDGPQEADRVLVITEWTSLTSPQFKDLIASPDPASAFMAMKPALLFVVNGRAWPHTERLTYDLGERVHWRLVNLSTQAHPMHLHGFYFRIDRQGDGLRDDPIPPESRTQVVTQLMPPGSTFDMTWVPDRSGRWLFHCHTMVHVAPALEVDGSPSPRAHETHNAAAHEGAGMKGLVLGIVVRGAGERPAMSVPMSRELTLHMRSESGRFGRAPALGFVLADGAQPPAPASVPVPGPVLVLKRGEPVAITLVNELAEATSIHWHGIELESYYDGVHGWSGSDGSATPAIEPGSRFVVRFTPPRAGTFIYHTHLHDNRQLTSGLYGALVVVEPDAPFDESVDHVFVLGRGGPAVEAPVVVNGQSSPKAVWTAGRRHRIRLINITPNDTVSVSLRTNAAPVTWRPLAKDGASLPSARCTPASAAQIIGVGETYDFEYEAPPGRQMLWLEVRSPGGKWLTQGQVIVR
jgi:FtsP/CotA-like multicopper oxidase with cupredoxin domain